MKQIYVNGRVFTGRLPLVEAFAVEEGRFVAAGSTADMRALMQPGDALTDLNGAFVCPGFNDSHMHLLGYGLSLECCELGPHTRSLRDMQDALRRWIAEGRFAAGGWVRGRGWNHDYFADHDGIPTRHELDAVSTEHPICIVRCCGHCLSVNTRALDMLGIDGSAPQPDGGQYDTDADGRPTGVFRDSAMSMIYTRLPQPGRADLRRMLLRACGQLNRLGVTSCHTDDLCNFEGLDWHEVMAVYRELESEGLLTVRVYEQSQLPTLPELRQFIAEGNVTGAGSDMLRIGPLKLLGDGSLGARTALLSGEYADAPGERGLAIYTPQQLDELVGYAHSHGMQMAIHAIGDGILDHILDAYERAFAACPRADHRSGIVHVQLTRPDQLERMRALGLHAYAQTVFIDYDSHIVHARAGEQLASTSYAFETLRRMGLHVSNGTDCPVEPPIPMRGIQCAVTRQPLDGSLPPYRPEEAMTVEQALRSYTAESAWASFEEHTKGCICPGMLADFAVLSADPFDTDPQQLSGITAVATYLGGRCVYAAG